MPAIRAYKGNGQLIPVDDAKLVRAYQCPWTYELFGNKASYLKHLRNLRVTRMHTQAARNRRLKLLSTLWHQPTWQGVIDWIHLHPEVFYDNAHRSESYNRKAVPRELFSIEILHLDLVWSPSVSNTHDAPHNGTTNWGRHEGKPRGYPGWAGSISFKISHEVPTFASDMFRGTRIKLGSGGSGGNNNYRHEVKFFDEDWPNVDSHRSLDILQGKDKFAFTYGKEPR